MARARERERPAPQANAEDQALELDLYRTMKLIRAVELEIEKMHHEGVMTGSFHSSMGQEAAAAGVCQALRPADLVTSTHRGHGHAVAKGVPVVGVFGELLNRAGGTSGGRGGSMHLHHRPSGFLGENAIVAAGLPWAAGAAWARRRQGTDDVSVAFTGDGGAAQGVFHEALRLAQFWNAPCLFVCENNGLAHSMPSDEVFGQSGAISEMVAATGMLTRLVDGREVKSVHRVAAELLDEVRAGRPAFLECLVFRVRPHSLSDPEYRYRPKDSGLKWIDVNDPIARLRSESSAADSAFDQIDQEVTRTVEVARAEALDMSPASPESALLGVYATPGLSADGPA